MAGRWLKVAPLMVAIAVAAAACGSSGTSPRASTAPASPAQGAPTSAAPMGAPTAVLYLKNLRFNPATIHVTPGQKVTVQVVNDDTVAHTFTIPGIVDTGSVSPGQSKTVTFTDDLRRPAVLPASARPQAPAPARLRPRPDAMRFTFGVPFVLVECETCHQERPAEAPCPHCGSRTLYDDPELHRRRAMVAEVRPVLDERPRPVVLDAGEGFTALGTWIDAFLRALQEAANTGDGASRRELAAQPGRFRDLAAGVDLAPRPAGQERIWGTIDGVLVVLRSIADSYLGALDATTPDEAIRRRTRDSGPWMGPPRSHGRSRPRRRRVTTSWPGSSLGFLGGSW